MIDSLVFHDWPDTLTLVPYLNEGWQEWVTRPGDLGGPVQVKGQWLYEHPRDRRLAGEPGRLAVDFETLKVQVLDRGDLDRVVLGYDDGLLATAYPSRYAAAAMVRAANDWTVEQWLSRDPRLFGLVLVSTEQPEVAAAEIRRVGANERMVGVALGANTLGRLFGDPIYSPIHQAAAEIGLPLVIQMGADAATDLAGTPVAGGFPATFAEYVVLGAQSLMSHAASLIMEGVFESFPDLKVLLVGGGATWLPSFLWRLDWWSTFIAADSLWLRRLPSEYFLDHVRLATYSLESPKQPERLAAALSAVTGIESMLLYASGRPNWDSELASTIAARLPESWHSQVFYDNADRFFRWPQHSKVAPAPMREEGAASSLPDESIRKEV